MDDTVGLLGLGGYVPDRVLTNDDWAERLDTSDEWITTRTGIKTRRTHSLRGRRRGSPGRRACGGSRRRCQATGLRGCPWRR